jgi:hypothetical protein
MFSPSHVFIGGGERCAVSAAFEQWCVAHPGAQVELGLSGRWVHSCVLPPEPLDLTPDQRRDYARRQFDHYFADGADERLGQAWALALSAEPDVPLACAVAQDVLADLRDTARRHTVRLRHALPWWARGLERTVAQARKSSGAGAGAADAATHVLAAVEPHLTTLLVVQGGQVQRVLTEPSAQQADWQARLSLDADAALGSPAHWQWQRLMLAGPAEDLGPQPVCDAPGVARVLRGQAMAQEEGAPA